MIVIALWFVLDLLGHVLDSISIKKQICDFSSKSSTTSFVDEEANYYVSPRINRIIFGVGVVGRGNRRRIMSTVIFRVEIGCNMIYVGFHPHDELA